MRDYNGEASLEELLTELIIQALMDNGGVEADDVLILLCEARPAE